jgi:hypothetical protein
MQTFRYLKKYTCELPGFNIQYKLLPREGASGRQTPFEKLSRSSQLNCICDHLAKQSLNDGEAKPKGGSQLFPLEPIGIFVGGEKLLSEAGPLL